LTFPPAFDKFDRGHIIVKIKSGFETSVPFIHYFHHYFDVDAEVIFDVCKNHIDGLANTINQIIKDISQ